MIFSIFTFNFRLLPQIHSDLKKNLEQSGFIHIQSSRIPIGTLVGNWKNKQLASPVIRFICGKYIELGDSKSIVNLIL